MWQYARNEITSTPIPVSSLSDQSDERTVPSERSRLALLHLHNLLQTYARPAPPRTIFLGWIRSSGPTHLCTRTVEDKRSAHGRQKPRSPTQSTRQAPSRAGRVWNRSLEHFCFFVDFVVDFLFIFVNPARIAFRRPHPFTTLGSCSWDLLHAGNVVACTQPGP